MIREKEGGRELVRNWMMMIMLMSMTKKEKIKSVKTDMYYGSN